MQEAIPAEEVCEYTYKVELIEKNKISLVVFNTTTGIKYQRYIEEYSDIWEFLKLNFQHSFSLCFKILVRALLEKDPNFNVSIIHNIDYVILQLSYINDLLGFTIDINVNQYKKDNLQESVNILDYKQNQLEDENKSLKSEIKHIHEELTELKRIINLLGDGFSYDNMLGKSNDLSKNNPQHFNANDPKYKPTNGEMFTRSRKHTMCDLNDLRGSTLGSLVEPEIHDTHEKMKSHPFFTIEVMNKLGYKIFNNLIQKYNIDYNIEKQGYDWNILDNMITQTQGGQYPETTHLIQYALNRSATSIYDLTWKSFKELFDIKI